LRGSYSVLPALSLSGILTVLIVKESFNAPLFLEFIELCLAAMNPFPADNSVLVLDNCAIHKSPEVRAMAEARYVGFQLLPSTGSYSNKILPSGVVLVYLPSYSPDYNPIELSFSKMKAGVKREAEAAITMLNQRDEDAEANIHAMLFRHVYSVTPDDARGYFQHCGYV
jgi:hypothetical protein